MYGPKNRGNIINKIEKEKPTVNNIRFEHGQYVLTVFGE